MILVTILGFHVTAFGQLPTEFQKVELLTGLKNSINFEFAPDGRIFILDRYGQVLIYKPNTQTTVPAGTLSVFHDMEDGLLAIAFDPDFAANNYVYIHYSPLSISVNRVSRFKMEGDLLSLSSEKVVLEWKTDRNGYFHAAGDMDFDSMGNLYIATGDNTNHSSYATLDETDPDKSSERTSSNTNDLRGKILRIKPEADGTYSIPDGNLFPDGQGGLPEIYVMGARNPFKIFVDKTNTDWLFWGEVGPDANSSSSLGPYGMDEINLTKQAGNYGWPYFAGKNEPYLNDYASPNFYYDPAKPVNISKWNTGITDLPPAQSSWLEFFHQCYLAGPRYYFDPGNDNPKKLPSDFHKAFFYYDFNSSKVWVVKMDDDGTILSTEQLAGDVVKGAGFIDLKIGPDGQLYILEYGAGCCPDNTGTGKLVRLDFIGTHGNSSPAVSISADVTSGSLPLTVNFSSEGTSDPEGDALTYAWDFDADGVVDSNEPNPSFIYTTAGVYNAQLRVDDSNGGINAKSVTIYAGNNAATFDFVYPPDGGMISWYDNIDYKIVVNDPEDGSTIDGSISCSKLNLVPSMGHLKHFHDGLTINQCEGSYFLDPGSHDSGVPEDVFQVLNVNYTDNDGLKSFDQIMLHPKQTEAEFYDQQLNTSLIDNSDELGGGSNAVRALSHGAYIVFEGRNMVNINAVSYRLASTLGGIIELRLGAPDGQLLHTVQVPVTGSLNEWTYVEAPVTDPGGRHDLYFVMKRNSGDKNLFDLNSLEFKGSGVSVDQTPAKLNSLKALSKNEIQLKFNEALKQSSAEGLVHYTINNDIEVLAASLLHDRRTVVLNVSDLLAELTYDLTVNGIENESGVVLNQSIIQSFKYEPPTIRLNAGGAVFATSLGESFSADQYFSETSSTFSKTISIDGTIEDGLYQSERYGESFSYNIPLASATYQLRLHFAELYHTAAGKRVFNVSAEGKDLLTNYDIIADVGYATAIVKEIMVEVTDGTLNLVFNASVDNAKLSAIEVQETTSTPPDNTAPVANAGDDKVITLPTNSVILDGSGTDADGTVNGYSWSQESGPGTAIFSSTSIAAPTVSELTAGTYIFSLIVTDDKGAVSSPDQVSIVVNEAPAGNSAPVADAGADQTVTAGSDGTASVALDGSASADADGSISSYSWKESGVEIATGVNPSVNLAVGSYTIALTVTDNEGATATDEVVVTVNGPADFSPVRLHAGGGEFTTGGGIIFAADQYFSPSSTYSNTSLNIAGTTDDALYQSERYGANFSYDIPVPSGSYLVRLHFAEIYHTLAGKRVFNVAAEGNPILTNYDIMADVGYAVAVIKESEVNVTDGTLNLSFTTIADNAKISAIEILASTSVPTNTAPVADAGADQTVTAGSDGTASVSLDGSGSSDADGSISSYSWTADGVEIATGVNPSANLAVGSYTIALTVTDNEGATDTDEVVVTVNGLADFNPIRLHAGGGEFTTGGGTIFAADQYFSPSNTYSNTSLNIAGTTDDALYQSERYGANFSYDIPVPSGSYLVRLHFAEIYHTLAGKRVFNVAAEGNPILTNYDIMADVGYAVAVIKESEVNVTDGTLNLSFTTIADNAKISAIEILASTSVPTNTAPVADAGADQTVTAGSDGTASVSLDGSGSSDADGSISSYSWTADGVEIATGVNPSANLAVGSYTIALTVTDNEGATDTDEVVVTVNGLADFNPIRLHAGGGEFTTGGGTIFAADQYFSPSNTYSNTSLNIAGTTDDALYQSERYGANFSYDIPVPSGSYLVRLHFAEIYHTLAGKRVFNVAAEGNPILTNYDIMADVGYAVAVIKESEVNVTDGTLNLSFTTIADNAKISAIEILASTSVPTNTAPVADAGADQTVTAGSDGTASVSLDGSGSSDADGSISSYSWTADGVEIATGVNPSANLAVGSYTIALTVTDNEGATDTDEVVVTVNGLADFNPIRLHAGGGEFTTGGGTIFAADQYFSPSNTYSNTSLNIAGTTDDALYQSERYGANFSYDIPVPSGSYLVRLHFAEIYFTAVGQRVFDVTAENNLFLDNFDIYAETGDATAAIKEVSVAVTDGTLNLNFNASVDNAKISAIEILSQDNSPIPSVAILSPNEGTSVPQSFNVSFEVNNWEVSEGGTHIHKIIDGVDLGEVYTTDPQVFENLSPGNHTIKLLLVNANHSPTIYSDHVQVKVVEDLVCLDNPFPLDWTEKPIGSEVPYRSVYIFSEDLDGDGLKDIVTGGWWYKNPGTQTGEWVQKVIGEPMNNMSLIHDFDKDGDMDIFGTQGKYISAEMAWAENDGTGNFTIHTNIPAGTSTFSETFMAGAAIGNYNGVENIQIAVVWNGAGSSNSPVQMITVPADPVNQAWTIASISQDSYGEAISAGDIDGDGDLDLFQGGNWLRNDKGSWTTFSTGVALPSYFDRNALGDLDGDGILDGVVSQIGNDQEVSSFLPPADPTNKWSRKTIGSLVDGGLSLDLVDIDFDGDLDVLTGEWKNEHRLLAFENDLCNTGTWIEHVLHPGGTTDHHDGTQTVDLDNDGDLDIISMGWDKRIPRVFVNNAVGGGENNPPVVANPIPNQQAIEGVAFNFTFAENTFNDPDGDILTYTAALSNDNQLPSWLSFEGTTRTFSGSPAASDVGSLAIKVVVSDGVGGSVSDIFDLTVEGNGGGGINTAPIVDAGVDQTITLPENTASFTAAASDEDGTIASYLWEKVSGPEASLSSINTATLSLSNLVEGSYSFKVTVTDDAGATASDQVNLTVNPEATATCQSLAFNGSIQLMLNKPLVLSGDFTIEYWAKFSGNTSNSDAPVSGGDSQYINYYKTQARLYSKGATGGNDPIVSSHKTVADTWTHYAFVRQGNMMKVYINGVEDVGAKATNQWTGDFTINNLGQGAGYLAGELDELRIWKLARSGTDIAGNYNKGVVITATGLAAYFNFEEETGVVKDVSGNGYDSQGLPAGISRTSSTAPLTDCGSTSPNTAPVANAGDDKVITLPTNSVALNGSGTDADGTVNGYSWSQESGPGTAIFSSTSIAAPTVSELTAGTYIFSLIVTDDKGAVSSPDQVSIVVNEAPAGNSAPIASAGADQTVTAGSDGTASISLDGSASADADGSISSYSWKESGV
ncbi:malectin domain-containing carbohydrate-binding protein, partial [Nafulsella turpanensis]|uniref:malectin domain-containing carbohydrate-binding protein n=1 Tax=Nafulsella turpanensis TaxID=1265690 RepID=UPI00135F13CD